MTDLPASTPDTLSQNRAGPDPAQRALSGNMLALILIAITLLASWQAAMITERLARTDIAERSNERLKLYESSIRSSLARYEYVPDMIARYPRVRALLAAGGSDTRSVDAVNTLLESLATRSRADVLYVLDTSGNTVASSNWRLPLSFVGRNYGFRPYFRDALAGGQGRFFAVGVTTGRAGFFYAEPVRDAGRIVGVAVVKIETETLQADWAAGGENVAVSDADGVVFLASREDWRYRALQPLAQDVLARIRDDQQYGTQALAPLQLDLRASDGAAVYIDTRPYLISTRAITGSNWTLHYASPLQPARDRAIAVAALGLLLGAMMMVAALAMRDRRLRQRAAAEREINRQLAAEIIERKRAEAELKDTQAELIQTGKLAALGRMSAAIAHELNQPLAAMRTFVSGSRIFLARGQTGEANANLDRLGDLADRMGKITGQLKTFARRGMTANQPVDLAASVSASLALLDGRICEADVTIETAMADIPVSVMGDTVRIEQVIVNLLANAVDAVAGRTDARVSVTLTSEHETARLRIDDNGPGIPPDADGRLFDPFFTTKDIGEGLGLGLSISYGIITDLGGTISATNREAGGASFLVTLPHVRDRAT